MDIKEIKRKIKLLKKFKLILHYDEIRRFSMVEWEDLGKWNSRIIVVEKNEKIEGIDLRELMRADMVFVKEGYKIKIFKSRYIIINEEKK